ncbi:oxidoreductase [Hydrogenophaga sp. IBVHS2]|uniref:oxidoreductase n=1 Tax=Hydrogenophaga sp. IBVHS2 TaxID=1985170 RepID=UPI000A2E377F|nr:oxidoreductase [Hydrogenophaga sp. IBVHS2]OSZ62527.1 short-chain dehydrogenase/reductase [Hydrogenophaga sp. IBVHS2]
MSKIWFITGAGRGLGAYIALSALEAGHRVVATGRKPDELQSQFADHGDRVLCVPLDVDHESQSTDAVARAIDGFGRIDVLVNNAGYGQLGLFEEVPGSAIEAQFQTNVFGLMHVTRAVLPHMRRQRSGHIFNIASIGGFKGFASSSIYCATKFAVEGFSESLAMEVSRFGIRVTTVEPGFFRTDFLDATSVRYGDRWILDYDDPQGATRVDYSAYNHRQPGDPARLGQVLVQIAGWAEPPLRFLAGSDAVTCARETFDRRQAEMAEHAELSSSTDFAAR